MDHYPYIASTSKHFTKELGFNVSESAVRSIKQMYYIE